MKPYRFFVKIQKLCYFSRAEALAQLLVDDFQRRSSQTPFGGLGPGGNMIRGWPKNAAVFEWGEP